MQRRTLLLASLGLGAACATQAQGLVWRSRSLVALGTTLRLLVAHDEPSRAEGALDAAVAVIRDIEGSMSLYRPDSELQRLNQRGHLARPSHHLLSVLRAAQAVAQRSQGAFDASVQPLWQLYEQTRQDGRLPTAAEVAQARTRVGWGSVMLSPQAVRLLRPGMALTLNGIAQGYAADAARAALQAQGVAHALLDTGEYSNLGHNPQGHAWTLGIEDPHDTTRLVAALRSDGRCLATSAEHRSSFSADHRHHHIFDPHTGDSPAQLSSVTVAAPSAMLADALTKVMFVAGPQRIPALAQQWQVGVLWVDKRGRWAATPDLQLA
jgi:thiamine biosynthesis lipoprotein